MPGHCVWAQVHVGRQNRVPLGPSLKPRGPGPWAVWRRVCSVGASRWAFPSPLRTCPATGGLQKRAEPGELARPQPKAMVPQSKALALGPPQSAAGREDVGGGLLCGTVKTCPSAVLLGSASLSHHGSSHPGPTPQGGMLSPQRGYPHREGHPQGDDYPRKEDVPEGRTVPQGRASPGGGLSP